jgi:ABC-type transport system substrate-binding protein
LNSDVVPQFRDKRVRQAISLALASEQAREIELFFNGLAIPAETPIPPGVSGYVADYKNPNKVPNGIDKAKRLLAEAGYKDGKGFPEIPYDIVSSTTSRQIAEFQAASLKKIGINLKILSNTWPEFQARTQRGQAHFWGIAWGADYPDAENFLQLFYGPNAQPGGMNRAGYKNPRFDEIFGRARIMPDGPARTKLYEQLARIVAEDVPVVFGVHRVNLGLTQPWLGNYKYGEFPLNEAKYLDVRLDVKAKSTK